MRGPKDVRQIVDAWRDRAVISLDMKAGRALADAAAWGTLDIEAIADQVIGFGAMRLIVLDLACVGIAAGVGTEELCRRLASKYPHVEFVAGGGVRGSNDLKQLKDCGVSAALVATALHEGSLLV